MTAAQVWLRDGLVPAPEALVPVNDRGFTSGDGVFEAMKVVDGRPFAVTRHLRRLANSADIVSLGLPEDLDLRAVITQTIEANAERLGYLARLRITVTAGSAPAGILRSGEGPTVVVTVDPQQPHPDSLTVITVPWRHNNHSAVSGAKTTSYAENLVILERARAAGADEALMADTDGRLCEGTTSNVILEVDGRLVTPSLATGCLPGVTRDLLIEWGIVEELDVPFEQVARASEILLSSSTRDLIPVELIDGRPMSAPGPLGGEAAVQFALRVDEDIDP
ncbi:MAG: aminotransferase class IV [Candidatus Nanopelagicales bacterium]|nr:aminotransferase class IV [Candidatus Nanopelagicales bacterium]